MEKELPDGWCWAELDDVGYWIGGGTPSKAKSQFWTSGEIPWVSPKDMKTFRIIDTEDHLSTVAIEEANLKLCPVGTILVVVRSGILLRKLPVAVSQVPLTINQDMKGICPGYNISSNYIAYYLIASTHDILSHCSKDGTTVTSLESGALKSYPIPLAPLNEQRRIVAAIEQQFSRLDAAVESLNHARKKLKRERAAILKAAVEGRLTEQWRAEHPETIPSAMSIKHILELSLNGESHINEKRRLWGAGHITEVFEEIKEILPSTWVFTKVRNLSPNPEDVVQIGPMSMKSSEFTSDGVPVLNVGCVKWGFFDLSKLDFLPSEIATKFKRYRLKAGDIVFTRSGTVGRCAIVREDQENWLMTFHLLRVRLDGRICLPKYLMYVFEGFPTVRIQISSASVGSTRAGFNTRLLEELDIPLPPVSEQQQIIYEVEQRLSIIARTEAEVEANLKRAARLRQAILSEAFAGRLVPQDPEDEPASVLLERIREERREREGRKKGKDERGNGNGNRNGHGQFVEVSSEPVRMDVEDVEQGALW